MLHTKITIKHQIIKETENMESYYCKFVFLPSRLMLIGSLNPCLTKHKMLIMLVTIPITAIAWQNPGYRTSVRINVTSSLISAVLVDEECGVTTLVSNGVTFLIIVTRLGFRKYFLICETSYSRSSQSLYIKVPHE